MKKLVLWTIGIFFLLVIIGNCAGSDKENTIAESSSQMQLEEISPEDESKIDSIDVVKIKELKQYFTEKKDEFSDVKWVEPKSRPKYTNQNGYCMYFSVNNGVASNPRFLIQYESDKWLFIKNMIFNIDGENITFTPEKMETDCGNGGRIWEWCDEYAGNLEPLIKKIAYAKSVKIKLVGKQYYNIKTI